MENKKDNQSRMNMITINGIIVALIGLLVLITPWVTQIAPEKLVIDYISGGILLLIFEEII